MFGIHKTETPFEKIVMLSGLHLQPGIDKRIYLERTDYLYYFTPGWNKKGCKKSNQTQQSDMKYKRIFFSLHYLQCV
jgi:hypothetical protein